MIQPRLEFSLDPAGGLEKCGSYAVGGMTQGNQ